MNESEHSAPTSGSEFIEGAGQLDLKTAGRWVGPLAKEIISILEEARAQERGVFAAEVGHRVQLLLLRQLWRLQPADAELHLAEYMTGVTDAYERFIFETEGKEHDESLH